MRCVCVCVCVCVCPVPTIDWVGGWMSVRTYVGIMEIF